MEDKKSLSANMKQRSGTWVFLGVVSGVQLTDATNFEIKLSEITLVSSRHLSRRRRRFGIEPAVGELRRRNDGALNDFFERDAVFATIRRSGKLSDVEEAVVEIIRDELAILAASQLGYCPRKSNASPSLTDKTSYSVQNYLLLNVDQYGWTHPRVRSGRSGILTLDERWKNCTDVFFFTEILKSLRGQHRRALSWIRDLKNALILIGQSQTSIDLPQAFLWDIIALELLLTRQGDKVSRELPKRAEAFLGWATEWGIKDFPTRIAAVYDKRNALVHEGRRLGIEPSDVNFVDDLLLNVLSNIAFHPKIFSSKDKLIAFSDKVQAERLLGIKPRVRPKSLRYIETSVKPAGHRW